jgi:N-methylhydantoinase A/oxoprolinase/acetone carboxylase beta subunit
MTAMIDEAVDRMKVDATPVPLIAVGGGAFLVPDDLPGVSEVIQVEHRGVANAVGAAIAQVSGEVDQVFNDTGRIAAIEDATRLAKQRTVQAGADPDTLTVVEVEDLPLSYVPGDALRVHVRVVGDTASA